jgi:UPF0271 protein
MARKINLNADMAEGYGAYDIGNDDGMLSVVQSANVACGFHAGDPNVMARVLRDAAEKGVSIGAHPGFNDLWGFGRRQIQMPLHEIENIMAYQIGALQGMASAAGTSVTHVKPHGALNNMASVDADLADAIARSVRAVDPSLILVAIAGTELDRAGHALGLPVASEVYADRTYADDGNLSSRKLPNAMINDPAHSVAQVMQMVKDGVVTTLGGKQMPVNAHTICVHGDEPTGVDVARAVTAALAEAGLEVVPLPDVPLG